ncbi:hypothetical protein [Ornithinimicrobium avium]|uniref:Uncharacterized protein n=1 Tax=Ornithinimicrobium avium TaxID=2283195 RepID=A0A345NQL1_9MICO|nr:hypothetical protein [Ornithinimicrobium avium]AXH97319.1 hypothetical protein DV701_15425 [Ornithinimicrobium avium]
MTDPGRTVGDELERVVRRWQQLPLDRALPAVPGVSATVQALADAVADVQGTERVPVPDLGPGVLMDQLRVMVYDWRAAGLGEEELGGRLTALRRSLP